MDTTWQMMTNRMNELQPLHKRMDESRDLAYLTPYTLRDPDNENMELAGAINVTGNWAAVFAHSVIQDLLKAQWQTTVEGLSDTQAHKIEEFIDANQDQADDYLLETYGLPGLYHFLCNHVCIRGPIGAQWYSWMDKGEYKIHCLPLDMRYVGFHPTMQWVAPILYLTKDEINEKYPKYKKNPLTGNEYEVRDYWDDEKEEIWIDGELSETKPNVYGKPPFVIVFPPSGFMLRDKGYIKHEGEDIFYLIRELNKENNRTLSIEQSLIYNVLRPGYEREQDNPDASLPQPVSASGEVQNVKKGERAMPVPTGDYNRATLSAKSDIQNMLAQGAPIAPRQYNTAPSGSELALEWEILSQFHYSPVLGLQLFKQRLARLMIEQVTILSKKYPALEIGRRGRRKTFSAGVLRDPETYSITYRGMTKNKRQELANLAMFAAAYDRLPLRYNLENILMVEDPEGIIVEMEIENAKKADPSIALFEMALKMAEKAQDIDDEIESDALKLKALMLLERAEAIVMQRRQPAQLPEKAQGPLIEQPKGGGNLLPAMIGGEAQSAKMPEETTL